MFASFTHPLDSPYLIELQWYLAVFTSVVNRRTERGTFASFTHPLDSLYLIELQWYLAVFSGQ